MIFTAHAHEMRATASQLMTAGIESNRTVSVLTIMSADEREQITFLFPHVTGDQLQALADEFNVIIAIGEAAAKDAGQ